MSVKIRTLLYTSRRNEDMYIQVNGATLKSLRERYKATIPIAARMTGLEPDVIEKWEKEGVQLSVTDTKRIAKAYHSHWSIFLQETKVKPIKEPINNRAGYTDNAHFSADTLYAYEVARMLINSSAEIEGQVVDPRVTSLGNQVTAQTNPMTAANLVRRLMGISSETIQEVRGGPAEIYKFWMQNVSDLGIYISEQKMPAEETKAFLLREKNRAVIVINKNDRYPLSKTFSLLHELGHLLSGANSAACEIQMSASRTSTSETWCNKFASQMVAFDSEILSEEIVNSIRTSDDPAYIIRRLSQKYKTSFTVMLYKLKEHGKVTPEQVGEMQTFFENVILPQFKTKKSDKPIKLGKSFYVGRDISKASATLSREVIQKQLSGKISYGEAAQLLGTKASYIENIKSVVGSGN